MVHILNGDAISVSLDHANIQGERIVCRELLCDGPSQYEINDQFWITRSDYFKKDLAVSSEEYYQKSVLEFKKIHSIARKEPITLWFEYDLFCQVNLIFVLNLLIQDERKDNLYLICVGDREESEHRLGLGEIDSKHYPELFKQKVKLDEKDFKTAMAFWKIWNSEAHSKLKTIEISKNFTYLKDAISAHLKRFRSTETFNIIDERINEILTEFGPSKKSDMIRNLLIKDNDFGFGDFQYQKYLEKLIDNKNLIIESNLIKSFNSKRSIDFSEVYGACNKI